MAAGLSHGERQLPHNHHWPQVTSIARNRKHGQSLSSTGGPAKAQSGGHQFRSDKGDLTALDVPGKPVV